MPAGPALRMHGEGSDLQREEFSVVRRRESSGQTRNQQPGSPSERRGPRSQPYANHIEAASPAEVRGRGRTVSQEDRRRPARTNRQVSQDVEPDAEGGRRGRDSAGRAGVNDTDEAQSRKEAQVLKGGRRGRGVLRAGNRSTLVGTPRDTGVPPNTTNPTSPRRRRPRRGESRTGALEKPKEGVG